MERGRKATASYPPWHGRLTPRPPLPASLRAAWGEGGNVKTNVNTNGNVSGHGRAGEGESAGAQAVQEAGLDLASQARGSAIIELPGDGGATN